MIEVYSKLFVGDELDYEHRVSHETGWAIVHVLCYIWRVDLTLFRRIHWKLRKTSSSKFTQGIDLVGCHTTFERSESEVVSLKKE